MFFILIFIAFCLILDVFDEFWYSIMIFLCLGFQYWFWSERKEIGQVSEQYDEEMKKLIQIRPGNIAMFLNMVEYIEFDFRVDIRP